MEYFGYYMRRDANKKAIRIVEYLGHGFFATEDGGIHHCKTCNLRVFIMFNILNKIEECLYVKQYAGWQNLDISCNEVMIKRLLE